MIDLKTDQSTVSRRAYRVTLTTLSPFRVGGVADPLSQSDNPIAVVGGKPCVPGSTLKGALRAEIERWLMEQAFDPHQRKWKDERVRPCIPSTKLSDEEQRLVDDGRYKGKACTYPDGTICPVCYLLGAQGLVGFVSVPFLFAAPGHQTLYSSSIDRAAGTVKKGTNRPYQLIQPETTFSGELEIILEDKFLGWSLGSPRPLKEQSGADAWLRDKQYKPEELAQFVVDRLCSIDRLGGYRSKGFGRVKIQVHELG